MQYIYITTCALTTDHSVPMLWCIDLSKDIIHHGFQQSTESETPIEGFSGQCTVEIHDGE